jgi:hypothetical protein
LAEWFHRRRINVGVLALAGFGVGAFATAAIAVGQWPAALALCQCPSAFPMLANLFAAACAVTIALRWSGGRSTFGKFRNSL